ncbi:MAG: flagellar basal-body rod protein FlgG [Oligoflexia bacterium]|nr:flagellar basal-body rod protein FlgG [Oligoflexia bacterium]
MLESLHTAASGMEAQKLVIDSLANDFANLNTTGFKKSRVDLQDLHYKTIKGAGTLTTLDTRHPVGIQVGRGVKVSAIHRVFEEGAIKATGNSMDMAIAGNGFFAVLRQGNVYYTRDGSFSRDGNGRIVTKNGFPLQPEVALPVESKGFTVSTDGVVTTINNQNETEEVGQVQIVNFVNPAGLSSEGYNLYLPTEASGNPVTGTPGSDGMGIIQQGFLESSNVNAVTGMVDMIAAQRGYELNSKVIQAADQMLQSVTNLR